MRKKYKVFNIFENVSVIKR